MLCVDLSASWWQTWVAALPVTSLSTGAPSRLAAAPMGSNLLLVDSSSQLSNLTGFALVFESGDPLPSPGSRHVDMHENPVSADPGPVATRNIPVWKIFTQAGERPYLSLCCLPGLPTPRQPDGSPRLLPTRPPAPPRAQCGPRADGTPGPEHSTGVRPGSAQLALRSPPWTAGPGEAWPPPPLLTGHGLGPGAVAAAHRVSTFYFSIWFL